VFAIWEPILPTDWAQPRSSVLQRLSDNRVRQFWDVDHLVAAVLRKVEETGKLHRDCCERKGFLWDLTAAYPPGAHWPETLPQPILFNGPVVHVAAELDSVLAKQSSGTR
jgi:hypothetical protein